MRFCFLTETSAWGGAEVHTVELAQVLAVRGHEVVIVTLGHDVYNAASQKAGARFKVEHWPLTRPVKSLSWAECTALVRGMPDGVGVLVRFGLAVGSLRLDLAARQRFRRYVAIEHSAAVALPRTTGRCCYGLLPGVGLWWYQNRLLWYLRSIVPHNVVCVSHAARQRLIRDFHVPARKVTTVYNGIDSRQFRPDAERRARVRREWGVPDAALVLGSVGRLHHDKGLDVAIEGLSRLTAQYPGRDIRLVLVGDGPARESLLQAARSAGIAERVVFAGFSDRPWESYPGLDIFLLPSRDEALSLALIEAMASGCCPIAMGVGGVPEVLGGPETGWLVPPDDHVAFMAAMAAAVQMDGEHRAAMGRAARARAVAQFDAGTQYAALADLLEAGEPPGRRALAATRDTIRPELEPLP